jgi:hypothetical protein
MEWFIPVWLICLPLSLVAEPMDVEVHDWQGRRMADVELVPISFFRWTVIHDWRATEAPLGTQRTSANGTARLSINDECVALLALHQSGAKLIPIPSDRPERVVVRLDEYVNFDALLPGGMADGQRPLYMRDASVLLNASRLSIAVTASVARGALSAQAIPGRYALYEPVQVFKSERRQVIYWSAWSFLTVEADGTVRPDLRYTCDLRVVSVDGQGRQLSIIRFDREIPGVGFDICPVEGGAGKWAAYNFIATRVIQDGRCQVALPPGRYRMTVMGPEGVLGYSADVGELLVTVAGNAEVKPNHNELADVTATAAAGFLPLLNPVD